MLRIALALIIGAHGIGHILFLVPLLGMADWGQSARSWLISAETPARFLGGLLWLATIVAFSAAVYGLLGEHTWWRSAAAIGAVVSIVGLIIFWANPATSPTVAALVFNLLVLGLLFIAHWPSVEVVGA